MKKITVLTALPAVLLTFSLTSFASEGDYLCGPHTAATELMRQIVARVDRPNEQDRAAGLVVDGRWEIPTSTVPYTFEAFVASQGILRPYFTHVSNRQSKWVAESSRGVIDLDYAAKVLEKKSKRKGVREALAKHNLRVKLDHRFDEILEKCAETPHGVPIWKKVGEEIVFDRLEKAENGRTLYYKSTWLTPEIRSLYRQAYAAGMAHSIGVFAVDGQGNETLAAGSISLVFDGTVLIATAFTEKKNVVDVSPVDAELPNKKRYTCEVAYPDAGHVEEAASLLYFRQLGFENIDSGLLYPNFGMYFYKEISETSPMNIPLGQFLKIKEENRRRNIQFPKVPADGSGLDITETLETYSAARTQK